MLEGRHLGKWHHGVHARVALHLADRDGATPPGMSSPVSNGARATPRRVLIRLFGRQFLANDLMSPDGDSHAALALVLAALATPGLWMLAWLTLTYSGPFLTPSERLLMALGHKYQFLGCSMIAVALATVLQWDALDTGDRDHEILGPLPVSPRTLLDAKAIALVRFAAVVAVGVNVAPTLGFPLVWLSLVPIGAARLLEIVLVHAVVSLGSAAFGFFAVLGLRSLLLNVCGPRLFRLASAAAQFLLVVALLTAFALLPALSSDVPSALRGRSPAVYLSPPMWFVGAYERLVAPRLYSDPQLTEDATWRFWERETLRRRQNRGPEVWAHPLPQFKTEVAARQKYAAIAPVLYELGGIGLAALLVLSAVATALYLLAHARYAQRLGDTALAALAPPRRVRPVTATLARRFLVRHPVERAIFFFTLQALGRSITHLLQVATCLAAALALIAVTLASALGLAGATALFLPAPPLLAVQLVLVCVLLGAVRGAFAIPAALPANWVFQLADSRQAHRAVAGVRRAMQAGIAFPVLVLCLPLQAALWGWKVSAFHLAVGWLLALILIELLTAGYAGVPFACVYLPGKARMKTRWPIYLFAFVLVTYGVAEAESAALAGGATWAAAMLAALAALFAAIRMSRVRRQRRGGAALVFDEGCDPAVQELGLTAGQYS